MLPCPLQPLYNHLSSEDSRIIQPQAASQIEEQDAMPIVDAELVIADNEQIAPNLAAALADAAAKIFGASAGETWVRLRILPLQNYAENGGELDQSIRPVFVTVLEARIPPKEELKREIERLTQEISRICGHPVENVHIFYQPEGRGRVAFGGD